MAWPSRSLRVFVVSEEDGAVGGGVFPDDDGRALVSRAAGGRAACLGIPGKEADGEQGDQDKSEGRFCLSHGFSSRVG
jgi:hypothetical protein